MIKVLVFTFVFILGVSFGFGKVGGEKVNSTSDSQSTYWLVLERISNREHLYFGTPGIRQGSLKVKSFKVKSGIPRERPTPLPQLLGRDYWQIVKKEESTDNPETAPYFLTLDVPVGEEAPFGPVPYLECGGQCNWELPGYFGLHGVSGDLDKLSDADVGSSGCVRHSDQDITFLYNLLDLEGGGVRYYIEEV